MKKIQLNVLTGLLFMASIVTGCGSTAQVPGETADNKQTAKWFKGQDWLNGLQIKPHHSVNQQEFSRQYHNNKVWWDKAFAFLKTNDLINLKPGSYVIDSGNVVASVAEVAPKERDQVNWEAHRNFNDLQYIVKGKVQMGVAAISDPKATIDKPYATRGDTETFTVAEGKYYEAEPGSFFIFSPKEIHRPAFKADGYDMIKKIVIKVRVPE